MSEDQTTSSTSNNKLSGSNNNVVALSLIGGSFISLIALTTPFITMQLKSSLPYMSTPRQKVEKALMFLSNRKKKTSMNNVSNNCYYSVQNIIDNVTTTKHLLCTDNHNNNIIVKKRQLHFVDLGSGDGTAVLTASKLGWHSTGIEMNSTLWLVSSIRRLFSIATSTMTTTTSKEIRSNSQFKLGDMFNPTISRECLHNADSVIIFGVQPLMSQISKLIESECPPGCYLMSYRFRIPLASNNNDTNTSYDDDDEDQEEVKRIQVENNKEESNTGCGGIHASLIYDEEEMRIYELHHKKR